MESGKSNLYEPVKNFDVAMLVTHYVNEMHARSMVVVRLDKAMDAYLLTDSDSVEVHKISENPHATLTFQSSRQFASTKGKVVVAHDEKLLETMWKEAWKVWFPLGKANPNIAILKFTPHEGEFWDNAGMKGLKFVYGAAKAYMTGEKPKPDSSQYKKIML
jgi:general stress protein 26